MIGAAAPRCISRPSRCSPSDEPTGRDLTLEGAPEWSSIAVGDHWIRTYQAGPHQASEAVVFIHGNPGSAADFTGLIDAVAPPAGRSPSTQAGLRPVDRGAGIRSHQDEYSHFVGDAFARSGSGGLISCSTISVGRSGSTGRRPTPADRQRHPDQHRVLAGYKWHRTARVWQTPVAGELLQAAAFRSMFRRIITRAEPHGLPRDSSTGCTTTTTVAPAGPCSTSTVT